MKEPINLRLSTCRNPTRGEKFEAVLQRRRASATGVIRALIDAYIKSEGKIDFPVQLAHDKEESIESLPQDDDNEQ